MLPGTEVAFGAEGEYPKGPLSRRHRQRRSCRSPACSTVRGGVGIDEFGKAHADYRRSARAWDRGDGSHSGKSACCRDSDGQGLRSGTPTTGRALVSALQWARSQGVQLVNLSLGTTNSEHEAALLEEVPLPGPGRRHCLRRAAARLSMAAGGAARRDPRRDGHDHAAGFLRDRDGDRGGDHRSRVRLSATDSGCAPGEEPQGLELRGRECLGHPGARLERTRGVSGLVSARALIASDRLLLIEHFLAVRVDRLERVAVDFER